VAVANVIAACPDGNEWLSLPHLGMDLLQAQILTEMLVEPLKFAVGSVLTVERPAGAGRYG
jgi:hypothetical protein